MSASCPKTGTLQGVRTAAVAFMAAAAVGPVAAHDFWIEPSAYRPDPESTLRVALRVGDHFDGRPIRRSASHIAEFKIAGSAGERAIAGLEGRDPAGLVRLAGEGAFVLAYSSRPSEIELPAKRFEAYLRSEGLERIIDLRAERGESYTPGREEFSRYAKSLVLTAGSEPGGPEAAGRFTAPVGLPLELVPETDPYSLKPGEELTVRLLYRSEPLMGALVKARSALRPERAVTGRTDADGRLSLALDDSGEWLVAAVHMTAAEPAAPADWRSLWASLTFELPGVS